MYLAQNGLSLAERQADGKYKNTWADDKAKLAKATEVFAFYKALIDKGVDQPRRGELGLGGGGHQFLARAICDGDRRRVDGVARAAEPRADEGREDFRPAL